MTFATARKIRTMEQVKATTIDGYISLFPKDVQILLKELRTTIKKAAPGSSEAIKYNMACFVLNGNLVYFAGFKNHIGFYSAPTDIEPFRKALSPYKTGKGSIQFPLDKPLPLDLITKMVKFRVQQNASKTRNHKTR